MTLMFNLSPYGPNYILSAKMHMITLGTISSVKIGSVLVISSLKSVASGVINGKLSMI